MRAERASPLTAPSHTRLLSAWQADLLYKQFNLMSSESAVLTDKRFGEWFPEEHWSKLDCVLIPYALRGFTTPWGCCP